MNDVRISIINAYQVVGFFNTFLYLLDLWQFKLLVKTSYNFRNFTLQLSNKLSVRFKGYSNNKNTTPCTYFSLWFFHVQFSSSVILLIDVELYCFRPFVLKWIIFLRSFVNQSYLYFDKNPFISKNKLFNQMS